MSAQLILYFEDDDNDVALLREALAEGKIGVQLVHVRTPWDFSIALKSQVPDLILLDGQAAGFGGIGALHIAQATCPGVPSFCLTELVTDEKAVAMRDAGVVACLSKSDLTEMTATIRRVLTEARTSDD